jgi:hypothetical protein
MLSSWAEAAVARAKTVATAETFMVNGVVVVRVRGYVVE